MNEGVSDVEPMCVERLVFAHIGSHVTLIQCWFYYGTLSAPLAQPQPNIGSACLLE